MRISERFVKDQNLVMITRFNIIRKCDLEAEAILSQRL